MDRKKLVELLGELPLKELAVPRPSEFMKFSKKWNAILEKSGDRPKVAEIIKILKASSDLNSYDGGWLNIGTGGTRIGYDHLANWLVWRAAHNSPDEAIDDLETSLGHDTSAAWDTMILDSLEVPRKIKIADEIYIMPLADAPESIYKFELEGQSKPFPILPGFYPPQRCALTQQRLLAPKFLNTGIQDDPIQHGVARDSSLFDLARCFTLIPGACPVPVLEYTQICDHVPCAQFTGWGAGSSRPDVVSGPVFPLTDETITEASETFALFRKMPRKEKSLFGLVMDRLNQAKRRHSMTDKAIDLGMALEVLLLRNERPETQLTMALRTRGAWLLGNGVSERKDIYRHLGKVYKHRSAAVHQGQLIGKNTTKQKEIENDLETGISLCIAAIKELMRIGYPPDWNDIILGGEKVKRP